MKYLPLLVIIPLADLYLLLRLAGLFGFLPTLALVLGTAGIGLSLAKKQGLKVIGEMQHSLVQGQAPEPKILEAVFLAVAAVLLLTPGLITDLSGFALLTPGIRSSLSKVIFQKFSPQQSGSNSGKPSKSSQEADYEILD